MVDFKDLELGKEYIMVENDMLEYGISPRYIHKVKVILVGNEIPINCNWSVLDENTHHVVNLIKNGRGDLCISTYRNEHLKYYFFEINKNLSEEINVLVEKYKSVQLEKLSDEYSTKKNNLDKQAEEFSEGLLKLLPSNKKKKRK